MILLLLAAVILTVSVGDLTDAAGDRGEHDGQGNRGSQRRPSVTALASLSAPRTRVIRDGRRRWTSRCRSQVGTRYPASDELPVAWIVVVTLSAERRVALHRRALWLEYFTVGWNVVEALVAIDAGFIAGSIALIGFWCRLGD